MPISGQDPPGTLEGYVQTFLDDFDTEAAVGDFLTTYANSWSPYPDGWSNTAGYGAASRYYPSRVVSAHNSCMRKYLHSEFLTSAELNINGGFGSDGVYALTAAMQPASGGSPIYQTHGLYYIRFRVDPGLAGFYGAWLMWPQSENWPQDGEIDWPEGGLDSTMSAFMHRQDGVSGGDQDAYSSGVAWADGAWHTAILEWLEDRCTFILDDVVIGQSLDRIPNTPMRKVIQTEACFGSCPDPSTSGYIEIDWVAIYAVDELAPPPPLTEISPGLAKWDNASDVQGWFVPL